MCIRDRGFLITFIYPRQDAPKVSNPALPTSTDDTTTTTRDNKKNAWRYSDKEIPRKTRTQRDRDAEIKGKADRHEDTKRQT